MFCLSSWCDRCGGELAAFCTHGAVLLDDRRLTTLDLAEIADLVPREARHLLAKAGVLDHVLDKHKGATHD